MVFRTTSTNNPSVSYLSLARLALPSILLQSGAPVAITFQTALLGHKSAELVAAWAIVATATNAATVIFNFLVVGVTAKVRKVIGAGAWRQVGSRIQLALCSALVMGFVAAILLWLLKNPIFLLLESNTSVSAPANEYFNLRVLGVPPQLLAMCTSGILQGYKRVYLVAAIQVLRLCLDVLASYVALYVLDLGIWGVGMGNLLASSFSALLAFSCILVLPPEEGRGKIHFLPESWVRSRDSVVSFVWGSRQGAGSDEKNLLQPLLQGNGHTNGHVEGHIDGANGTVNPADNDKVLSELGGEIVELEGPEESFWKFAFDGFSTLVRFALVQASFFSVLASVTVLGTHAVAAHQVVMQLWMLTVYCADGFATAATIVGSELAGKMERARTAEARAEALNDLRTMSNRALVMGTAVGFAISGLYLLFQNEIMALFTEDPLTHEQLRSVWLFLVLVQPLNAIVFVYDGLIYAAQAFSFMSACLTVGFFLLFVPSLVVANVYFHTLLACWFTKAILNVVRLGVAFYRIQFVFLDPKFEQELQ